MNNRKLLVCFRIKFTIPNFIILRCRCGKSHPLFISVNLEDRYNLALFKDTVFEFDLTNGHRLS